MGRDHQDYTPGAGRGAHGRAAGTAAATPLQHRRGAPRRPCN